MLRWPTIFFLTALAAAVFGFVGTSMNSVLISKVVLSVFLLLFIGSMIWPRHHRQLNE